MARKLYLCAIEQTVYFNIEANNEDQVIEWLNTHSIKDVEEQALVGSFEYYWDERICDVVNVGDCDSHIILKGDD